MINVSERSCPVCGGSKSRSLIELKPDDVLRSNWSYRAEKLLRTSISGGQLFPVVRCLTCKFVYSLMLPDIKFLKVLYDDVIDARKARESNLSVANLAEKMSYLTTLLRLVAERREGAKILDYGCGFGPTLELLRGIPAVEGVGYETSELRLKELYDRRLEVSDDWQFIEGLGPYDAVILDNVLEHVVNPSETLGIVRGACKDDAVLYVSVPDIAEKDVLQQRKVMQSGGAVRMDLNPWEHLNYFTVSHLDGILAKFEFKPLLQSDLPGGVNIGLRPSSVLSERTKNSLASLLRLLTYVRKGDVLPTVCRRFYRLSA